MSSKTPPLKSLLLLVVLLCMSMSRPAFAWVELHVLTHEARVELNRQGSAKVDHVVRFKVGGGPLRVFDLKIADRNIVLGDQPFLAQAREGIASQLPVPVTVDQRPDGTLRVEIDGKRGVSRGVYELRLSYTADLLRQDGVMADGSMLRVSWVGPRFEDGIDNAKCTFVVPTAPTEPRVASDRGTEETSTDAPAPTVASFLPSLSRMRDTDELTLLRPHVAKGEAVAWAVRVDGKALGEIADPRMRPIQDPMPASQIAPQRRAMGLALLGGIALLYSLLLALKHRQVARAAQLRGSAPRPMVPIGVVARVALAGPLMAGGLALQWLLDDPLPGTALIAVAMMLAAYRAPNATAHARGPGRWLVLSDLDAFEAGPTAGVAWLDASTRAGKVGMAGAMALHVGLVAALARISMYHAWLAAFDGAALLVLFGTGLRRWMPPDAVFDAAPILTRIAKVLRQPRRGLKVTGLGRIPTGASKADEVRLCVKPRVTLAGFVAMEVGVGWLDGMGGPVAVASILVRVLDGSRCHQALQKRIPRARWQRGRDTHERVLVVTPPVPTSDATILLSEDVVTLLEGLASPAPVPPARAERARRSQQRQPRAPSSKARRSAGSDACTSNAGTVALPWNDTW